MKMSVLLISLITLLFFTSYSSQEQLNQELSNPNPPKESEDITDDPKTNNKQYAFDVSKEWDTTNYKDAHGQDLYYFTLQYYHPINTLISAKTLTCLLMILLINLA